MRCLTLPVVCEEEGGEMSSWTCHNVLSLMQYVIMKAGEKPAKNSPWRRTPGKGTSVPNCPGDLARASHYVASDACALLWQGKRYYSQLRRFAPKWVHSIHKCVSDVPGQHVK
eukprot:2300217-Amphidinium_carterae.1